MKKTIQFFEGFKEGQKYFAHSISALINAIILSFAYFIGIGLTSMAAKISRKRFLQTTLDSNSKTYWEDLNLTKKKIEDYYKQF